MPCAVDDIEIGNEFLTDNNGRVMHCVVTGITVTHVSYNGDLEGYCSITNFTRHFTLDMGLPKMACGATDCAHIPVVKPVEIPPLRRVGKNSRKPPLSPLSVKLVSLFSNAAKNHGWHEDQGSPTSAAQAKELFEKAEMALTDRLLYLEVQLKTYRTKYSKLRLGDG